MLLVDDRPDNLDALELVLEPLGEAEGVRLVRAASAEEALRHVLQEDFAVILLDVEMPGMRGPEVARLIKARTKSEHVPIIFLTALDHDRRYVTAAYASGAVDYLTKPFDPEVLRSKVTAFVDLHRRRRDAATRERRRFADQAADINEALRASEERFRAVHEASPDGFMLFRSVRDRAGRITDFEWLYANPAAAGMVGRSAEDLFGRRLLTEMPDSRQEGRFDAYARVVETGEPWQHELAYKRVGLDRVFRTTAVRVDEGLGVTFSDVTARHRAEEALKDSEARLAGIIGSAMDAIVTTDGNQRVVLFNAAAERLLGVPAAEALGAPLERFIPERFRPRHRADVESFGRTGVTTRSMGHPGQVLALRADGTEFPIEASISQVATGAGRLYTVILRDVTERLAVEREHARLLEAERAARTLAEAAERAKGEFLATMSHELRTPLNAIVGYVQLLDLGIAGPVTDDQRGFLRRLAGSAQHLLGLVTDVLDLSKVDAGQMSVVREYAEAGPTIDAALALAQPQAEARGLRLVNDCAGRVPFVGDEYRVRQILINLISNAIKFTEPGGRVDVLGDLADAAPSGARVSGGGPWAVIQVRDTGIGIAPEHQQAIFEPFKQIDGTLTRRRGGTGLGLTISRRLARLMGGDLTLESAPGGGSTFSLWLPAAGGVQWGRAGAPETAEERGSRAQPDLAGLPTQGLAEVGTYLRAHLEELLDAYVGRLRSDPLIDSVARGRTRAELEDHALSFLADVFQSLVVIPGASGSDAELLSDGSEIQRTVAALHGRQRQRLGWSGAQLAREHEILGEETESLVARGAAAGGAGDASAAREVLRRLLGRAGDTALRAHRHAAGVATRG
ncbi:MAG TPA: ATP-binding protein [Gemmatimonadaceae bacterium]|nr:ATP-binding protein [Gemmatimonadaceae bacterium]